MYDGLASGKPCRPFPHNDIKFRRPVTTLNGGPAGISFQPGDFRCRRSNYVATGFFIAKPRRPGRFSGDVDGLEQLARGAAIAIGKREDDLTLPRYARNGAEGDGTRE